MARSQGTSMLENPSFRAHLIWVVASTTAALLLVSCAVILLPLLFRFDATAASPEETGRLADRILALHETLWPLALICLLAVTASSWLLYQRMVAPLVRFTQVFAAVRDGRLPGPVQLRGTDYLTREADVLNEMTRTLRERQAALAAALGRLGEPIDELAESAALRGDAELSRLLATLQDREKQLADQVLRVVAD
jgi:methyl-accepting chemotaxis protein